MTDHAPRLIERQCDVAVIGGSAAGLAAALQLARQRRSVIVIDTGTPRNAPAAHMHSYLGHEGIAPADFAAIAREEVRSYGVEVLDGRALDITRTGGSGSDEFCVELVGGHTITARRVLAATGLVDELPEIDGLTEHWGGLVIHCPFCHGYEVRDQRIVQIVTHPTGLHAATLFRQLSDHLTLVLHAGVSADQPELDALRASGVRIIDARVVEMIAVGGDDGGGATLHLANGESIEADVVAVGTHMRPRVEAFASLGITAVAHESGLGSIVATSPTGNVVLSGGETLRGVYAAGNVTDLRQQVLQAAADGSWVGGIVGADLASDDLARHADPTDVATNANEADWDHRYRGDQLWSGNPNGTLVNEVTGMQPGRALDIGAGEGGDALWLAEHGWRVTANDISQRGLDRLAAEAQRRGVAVEPLRADANAVAPFETGAFDLVTAHYASIPRTRDGRAIEHMLAAVAPGGTLLVVGHDLAPMREPIDTNERSKPFDPDAYVRVDDVAAVLARSTGWHVEEYGLRPRPPGHSAASHHVDDMVLRARRVPPPQH